MPYFLFLGAGRELELRGRSPSRPKPHPTSDDASGADCVRAFLFSGSRRMKFRIDKFLKFHYR
ncbi:hypothetical protein [uncultured Campylobacter sp.]|uniref:hypothetical protein n=1 Tax=uncultured Campylobacter sp. TaxID=218934 RepID=UPI0026129026|nr:hypothetical protein [uncultured Campylobacter sp.]